MEQIIAVLCFVAALTTQTSAGGTYLPSGYERAHSEWCEAGHFLLIDYIQPPWDFLKESQIWVEYSDPKLQPQHLFTYTNRAQPYIDDTGDCVAIMHHKGSDTNLLYLFVREKDHRFRRVSQELRSAALREFNRQTRLRKRSKDFEHLDCYPSQWLEEGVLRAYIQGNERTAQGSFVLKPWYFLYDAKRQKFVPHVFPENEDAYTKEPPFTQ